MFKNEFQNTIHANIILVKIKSFALFCLHPNYAKQLKKSQAKFTINICMVSDHIIGCYGNKNIFVQYFIFSKSTFNCIFKICQ